MKKTLWAMTAAVWLAGTAVLAAKTGEKKLLDPLLAQEPCTALFGMKPGEAYRYQWIDCDDTQDRRFLVLKLGGRRVLLELRLIKGQAPEVVERRAWVLRRGRRLLTEADGFGPCETRLAVPEERLEAVLSQAEAGAWSTARWPKAQPSKAKTPDRKNLKKKKKP